MYQINKKTPVCGFFFFIKETIPEVFRFDRNIITTFFFKENVMYLFLQGK